MGIYQDTFQPPALDATKWTPTLVGSVGLDVGSPTDGVYPLTVDDDGDAVVIVSDGKIPVASIHPFDMEIGYRDVYPAPTVNTYIHLGWRSVLKGGGVPLWGVDVLLKIAPGPAYTFQKRTVVNGVVSHVDLVPDTTFGADSTFRIVRSGTSYALYHYNSGWVLLDTVALGFDGLGFVTFGVFTEALAEAEGFPWIYQP